MIGNQVSQSEPQIENPKKLPLPAAAEAILKQMFATHQRVFIEAELGSGFSGSQVFVVHPVRDASELPVVIKMAPVAVVEKEYRAYREYIRNKLAGAAEIRGEPVLLPGSDWAGLLYNVVGSGIFEIESLYSFCHRASIKDTGHVLERLFRRMGSLWRHSSASPLFNLRPSYDCLLPVNLLIEPTRPPPDAPLHLLKPGALSGQPLQQGDYVRLEGFVITEVDRNNQAVTLNLPAPTDGSPASYRLRLQPIGMTSPYQVGDIIDSIEGVVTATRYDLLQTYAQRALGQELVAETLTLPGKINVTLPNPLAVLPDVLGEARNVRVACIHGDLNLENILVDPETRDVRLIDFAMARRDHVLHDLLRIETGVVTWLLPEALAKAGLPPETIHDLYEQLHCAARLFRPFSAPQHLHPTLRKTFVMLATIRKMARDCLFNPDDWGEYYQGLTLYLLGALKFKSLDDMPQAPLPKLVAFWGAAAAQKLLREHPPCGEMTWKPLTALMEEEVPFWRRVPVWAWGAAIGVVILLAVVGRVFIMPGREGKPTPAVAQTITPAVTVASGPGSPTAGSELPAVASPTSTAVPSILTPTPTVTMGATQTSSAEVTATVLTEASATTGASVPTPTDTPTPTQTPVPPTATATHTPRPPTPTLVPTAVPQSAGPIVLTIYLRDTLTEMGFTVLSDDQPNGGMTYKEGKLVYGEAAVQLGETVYHFDKPEVGPGEPEQVPDPWRVEFEFAEELVARTGGMEPGFDPKKARFWVGALNSDSAVGEDSPYSLTMRLYEGNELRESIQVFFTVADAPEGGGGGESGPGGKPPMP